MKMCDLYRIKRETMGLSQKKLADLIGISPGTISNFEASKKVNPAIFYAIRNAIDKEIDKLPEEERYTIVVLVAAYQMANESDRAKKRRGMLFMMKRATELLIFMDKDDEAKSKEVY